MAISRSLIPQQISKGGKMPKVGDKHFAYNKAGYEKAKINILLKDGSIKELKDASDQTLNQMFSKRVNKFFLFYLNIKQL